ncbi:dynein regulatory complex protein 11 isoform X2 [Apus apus]|uniref:dynein regulatory complex protein 11 isoform X2 n=1 Tax=Apus apus TaxID=8895 RepID=UPI0021F91A2C|nr:dynein regulatory complex protein 11 isoform X2 [Apus apus]
MSQATYNKLWRDAMEDLDIQLQKERGEFLQPEENHKKVLEMLTTSYIKYMRIFRSLETAHDHLVNQQKQSLIRQVLDGVIGRILEIKKEMVELENSEFQVMDDTLVDLQLLPEDLEVPIPRYFIKENLEVLQERERILDEVLLNESLETEQPLEAPEEPVETTQAADEDHPPAAFMKQTYLTRRREIPLPKLISAATCIQKVWRGYIQRKKTDIMREEEMIFLGMSLPPPLQASSVPQTPARQVTAQKAEVQKSQEKVLTKEKLRERERLNIKEDLQEQMGQCFIECRHILGRFPDYPTEKAGGSMALFSQKTPEQVAAELAAKEEMALQNKDKAAKDKMKDKTPQKPGKKEKPAEEEEGGWRMAPSHFLSILEEGNSHYKAFWQKRDQRWDFLQDHDPELIKEVKEEDVEEELRMQVGELMQQKLEDLRLAVDGEKRDKPKKGRKGAKSSKGKKTKGKKKRSELEEDLTPDRTIESLYKELVAGGFLIKAQNVNISDYLGSPTVHERAPLVKALLLAGPSGVGKKMLVHAICRETGANLFNLSASNLAGKFPSRKEVQLLLHMVLKVAKELQPSVVWVGETEKVFSKAGPKAGGEMSSLEKLLPEFLKALKAQDRVLLVGTTSQPFQANPKPFCKLYQKILLVPRPDYASRHALWKHFILQHGGVITKRLKLSSLAEVSDGFTQGKILQAVQGVLKDLRLLQMDKQPLRVEEFLVSLGRLEPVYQEEEEAFKAWYARTPLGQAWSKALAARKEEEDPKKKGKGKK